MLLQGRAKWGGWSGKERAWLGYIDWASKNEGRGAECLNGGVCGKSENQNRSLICRLGLVVRM